MASQEWNFLFWPVYMSQREVITFFSIYHTSFALFYPSCSHCCECDLEKILSVSGSMHVLTHSSYQIIMLRLLTQITLVAWLLDDSIFFFFFPFLAFFGLRSHAIMQILISNVLTNTFLIVRINVQNKLSRAI